MLHNASAGAVTNFDHRVAAVRHRNVFQIPIEQRSVKRLRLVYVRSIQLHVHEWVCHCSLLEVEAYTCIWEAGRRVCEFFEKFCSPRRRLGGNPVEAGRSRPQKEPSTPASRWTAEDSDAAWKVTAVYEAGRRFCLFPVKLQAKLELADGCVRGLNCFHAVAAEIVGCVFHVLFRPPHGAESFPNLG